MDTIHYIGEHLWPGHLGQFFIVLSLVAALFSAYSYFRSVRTELTNANDSRVWRMMGRGGFAIHAISVAGIFVALFYIISHHYFEYHYAWEHSSLDLQKKFLLSSFWGGQEGSFMLWTAWHAILGLVVMRTSKVLEGRVMTIISVIQVCLATMILGVYIGPEIHIGTTPFILLRDSMQAPIFSSPNYLSFIKDGQGLNVLLRNYWMTIHPPVLFLGFSSTLIPFSYVIAGLWKNDYQEWVKPTLVWSLFAGAVLGTGIMMGGAWAYESLNFGGYWAWDPVENASLVPWLTLIAGLHTLLIYKSTKRSLPATLIFFILTYLLVWYSTFLTRTGILGKTSVHAFTGDGSALTYHLLIVIGLLLILSIGLLIKRWKDLPRVKTEEATLSREFWMFIGSFILLLSSVQIAITTSIPVWSPLAKAITGKDIAPPVDRMLHYNSIQVWVAIIIGLLSAMVIYMKFRQSDTKTLWRRLGLTAFIALVMAFLIGYSQKITAWQYALMLFAACYGIVANVYYAFGIQKAKLRKIGAAISHFGFATVLLGILLSSYNKHIISLNTLGVTMDFGKGSDAANAKESQDNVLLFQNTPVAMGDYFVTYRGDSTSPKNPRTYYRVDYRRIDSQTHKVLEAFTLYPNAFVNSMGQKGLTPVPATKHYWNKDIFTYVTSVLDPSKVTDTSKFKSHIVHKGDTVFLNEGYIVFNGFNTNVTDPRYKPESGDIAVGAKLSVYNLDGLVKNLQPIYYIRDRYEDQIDDTLSSMNIYVRFGKIIPSKNAADIMVKETNPKDNYIVLKALVFPFINVLWIGVIIMVIGFFLSLWNRLSKKEQKANILDL